MRVALVVEYEGTDFHGFQYQANASSIQEELEKAIASFTGEKVRVKGAGRTDAGVHAAAQVVAFNTTSRHGLSTFVRALNFYLPEAIAVKAAYGVDHDFDPRRSAINRWYRYTVLNSPYPSPIMRRTAYLVEVPLDVRRMQKAAKVLVGRHDFAGFAGPLQHKRGSTVRYVYSAAVRRSGEVITFDIVGSSFLPHQVRRTAGALVEVGKGKISVEEFQSQLEAGDSVRGTGSLPPHGLCLMQVAYRNFPPEVGQSDVNEY